MKLTSEVIENISRIKREPKFMLDFRLKALESFNNCDNPNFGPKLDINYDKITYYKERKGDITSNWNDIDKDIYNEFDNLGLIKAEKNYLDGIGAQYDSEVIYHNMIKELEAKNVIFLDTDTALKRYPELFMKYFNTLVKYDENKFTALNGAVWSGGTFIYIPPNTKLDRPLQSYFRINTKNMGQFERTLIIVDDNSELHYIEGCTAPTYSEVSLHAAVVEIFVGNNARCRYTTIQNWSSDVYNLVTKRAIVSKGGLMEWIDGNIGAKVNMKYPCCVLNGEYARGVCISVATATREQIQDAGAKMIHLAPYTKSTIVSKSICSFGGNATYRGLVKITDKAHHSVANVKCDTIILDNISKSDTIPTNILNNSTSLLEHEATISKIGEDQMFYLMTRGIGEDKAKELIVMGFVNAFREELPMEYAVELNRLLSANISGM
ncbi:MAG: Fe-S cluster assembly protein SufB [Tenericutes bacterium]|nr:Fe-S cluster assembly protein SufB [Mycoplasmatota bacterium]